ncbi:hypothetical protein LCGC14_1486490 [marine sediment metagenome]|uniref:Uncharacterized protein n=1 Tax=marine sediment metagenome TaxID=412755 RepID=A0A0F9M9Y0_9ZZZZ
METLIELQQTKDKLAKGNVIEKGSECFDCIFVEDCECKSLFRTRKGFKCLDCGRKFEISLKDLYKEREL